jgi:PilS N terminal
MTVNIVKMNNRPAPDRIADIDRGWLGLEAGGVLLLIMVGTVLALVLVASLFSKNDTSTELSSAQFIMNQTRGLLKSRGSYEFSSAAKMTGTLIQFGGIPAGMTINGNAQSGTATAVNVWGGDVLVAPEKVSGSANNKGFSVTWKNVPQEACVTLATKMSETSLVSELSITGTNNTGGVSAEKAGAQCKADNGPAGTNTLIFKSNN